MWRVYTSVSCWHFVLFFRICFDHSVALVGKKMFHGMIWSIDTSVYAPRSLAGDRDRVDFILKMFVRWSVMQE